MKKIPANTAGKAAPFGQALRDKAPRSAPYLLH